MNCYEIFRECFPGLNMSEEVFRELSEIEECEVFTAAKSGREVGFALTKGNEIRLICVLPEFRGQGYGKTLLSMAEGGVKNPDEEITAGSPESRLFIGAPEESAGFFGKFGYDLKGYFAEMGGDSDSLVPPAHEPRGNVSFGFYPVDEKLLKAVGDVEDDWVRFFESGSEVFCGFIDGEIASFCMVEEDVVCLLSGNGEKIGSIGCVGTVPKFRRRGIGLKMVYMAGEELKKRGFGRIFIHYTHVYDWYAKLGYRTFLKLKMGGKRLKNL